MKNTILPLLLSLLATTHAPAQATLPPEMVFVEGGTFTMGCTPEQGMCYLDNYITRIVRSLPFYIGKYEVTQAQWEAVIGSNPVLGTFSPYLKPEMPVFEVNFYDCATFCNRLSIQQNLEPVYYFDEFFSHSFDSLATNPPIKLKLFAKLDANGFRLPFESEWEFAARGGKLNDMQTLYSGSNNFDLVSSSGVHPVGTKVSNNLGIHDMTGNLFEWCYDEWSVYARIPDCITTGKLSIRGGCGQAGDNLSVSSRGRSVLPGEAFSYWGLRLARNAD